MTGVILCSYALRARAQGKNAAENSDGGGAAVSGIRLRWSGRGRDYGGSGLTAGGFYAHFPTKRALFDEALATALAGSNAPPAAAKSARADEAGQLRLMIKSYLSQQHRDQIADGCPLPALTPDAARGGETSHENYERQLLQYVVRLEALLSEGAGARGDTALALMAQCVGGLMLARAVKDERLSDRILKACR